MDTFLLCGAVLFWALLIIGFIRDRSRYRNCYYLFFALVFSIGVLSALAGGSRGFILNLLFILIIIILLVVPFFLIANGVIMFIREGHSLANMLSLVFGLLIGAGEVATFIAITLPGIMPDWAANPQLQNLSVISLFFSVSVIYISMVFVVFMLYCVFLQIIPRKRDFDYVIIHGAGLLDGERVSKLLSDRLDKAIEVYRKDPTPPIMIPSGGKGSDEKISEAEAMEKYLQEKGIPAENIIREDRSTTTFENLKYSKEIIDAREGSKYTVLVTSNYHVYRALRYCRRIGLKCTGVGSHTAFYYWPSALIREFIAVHAEKKHFIILVAGWLLCMMPFILSLLAK